MSKQYITKSRTMLHGGDYNPDQWLHMPEIIGEDFRLMKLAGCNAMSVGIFAWAALEPQEGKFTFEWLDDIMDRLAAQNAYAVLATPSGARPAWMSQKYPEVLRVSQNGHRNLHGIRHNHCFTSPVYREKVSIVNRKLAERYKDHPAILVWHLSNEYSGECYCELCQEAFRRWLKKRYNNDLNAMNKKWWNMFWAHTYNDWSQVVPPMPHGEPLVHALNLDWKRFITDQTIDFINVETAPLKEVTPGIPTTTNFMGTYQGLNYWKLKDAVDVISWDSYPQWHRPEGDIEEPSFQGFIHDMCRTFKGGKPFMLMESTPSTTNWMSVSKRKRPNLHVTSSLLAVAHGSDTVQYFQWRKSRGSCEKFHGAVVDHCGHENTRVFRDVAGVGKILSGLDDIVGTTMKADVALLYDWENNWALDDVAGFIKKKDYVTTCHNHYKPFWKNGIPVDVVNMDCDFSPYRLLIAPMLYMVRPGVAERIEDFVKNGGTFVTTYLSGMVDETDLCFLGGFPGPLRKVLGIWDEETDAIYDADSNAVVFDGKNNFSLKGEYPIRNLCALIHTETAETIAEYKDDFYAGRPAVTVNGFGKGKAYYIASRNAGSFHDDFYSVLAQTLSLEKNIDTTIPEGVSVQMRTDGAVRFLFVMNFINREQNVDLGAIKGIDMISGKEVSGTVTLSQYGSAIIRC